MERGQGKEIVTRIFIFYDILGIIDAILPMVPLSGLFRYELQTEKCGFSRVPVINQVSIPPVDLSIGKFAGLQSLVLFYHRVCTNL